MIRSDDPRVTDEHVQHILDTDGIVTLIGVVHDHPASVYRVQHVITECEPSVLALELPPLALPLYERYAEDETRPPTSGGEMSAAIQAAGDARVVGIDGPSLAFFVRLSRTLLADRASPKTLGEVGDVLKSATKTAVGTRIAATLSAATPISVEIEQPVEHVATWEDDPERQAADERRQIDRAHAVMNVLEPSRAVRYRDGAREAHMASRLRRFRRGEHVVAVVGRGHFDALVSKLAK